MQLAPTITWGAADKWLSYSLCDHAPRRLVQFLAKRAQSSPGTDTSQSDEHLPKP